ncbi:MAG: ABC transporter ATP-binding protein [Ruminococcaceae bacterium]|nr:ABC transporter ATP-binding protein [Oscillospiraceae bacterium]
MGETPIIRLEDVVFEYDGERVLDGINLSIRDKEFVTFLGPSGCGKTTTLRIIGGFMNAMSGKVYFEGKECSHLPPNKRNINTVFQKYALFPHLNVFDNVAFGLKVKKLPQSEIKARVAKMLELVNLKGFDKRKVNQLSGGQQQRVAIARALVNYPKVLLLDEPLGALDLKLRKEMQLELKKIQQSLDITFIYVTHDQEEALTMSDTVVVMKDGVIQQVGTPQDIYNEPKNAFVADFIGESNIIDAVMVKDFLVRFQGHDFTCVDKGFAPNQPVDVVIRPEDIKLTPAIMGMMTGEVESVVFKGVHYEISVDCDGHHYIVHSTIAQDVGDRVGINIDPGDIHIMNRLFADDKNTVYGTVTDEDTVEFCGFSFTRENLGLEAGTRVLLTIQPSDIEVVSEDIADSKAYLESLVYKGRHNELIVWMAERQWLIHSQLDEQVATDIGIKFDFDKIEIAAVTSEEVGKDEE